MYKVSPQRPSTGVHKQLYLETAMNVTYCNALNASTVICIVLTSISNIDTTSPYGGLQYNPEWPWKVISATISFLRANFSKNKTYDLDDYIMESSALHLERYLLKVGYWLSSDQLKLNADKTELLWAGSNHSRPLLGDCGLSLQFGVDTVVSSNDTRVCLEWQCHQIRPWISTSLRSSQPVFIGSSNWDVSSDHWIQSRWRRWSMPSLLLASTTVMYTAGRRTEGHDWHVTASLECSCTSC